MRRRRKIVKKHRENFAKRRRRNRTIVLLVSLAVILAAGYWLSNFSYSPKISIETVNVRGASIVSEEAVRKIFDQQTAAPFLGLFSRKNALLLPYSKIKNEISESFRTVAAVNVSFESPNKAVLSLKEREPFTLWCLSVSATATTAPPPQNPSNCFYADKTGFIFAEAPKFSGDVFVIWSGFVSNRGEGGAVGWPVGQNILSEADFVALNKFMENLSGLGLKISSVAEVSQSEVELRAARTGTKILIDRRIAYDQTLQNLDSIIAAKQVEFKGKFLERLEQIDARFGGKAFIKIKN